MADQATTSVSTDAGSTETPAAPATTVTSADTPVTYTQEQLDSIVTERVNRSKAQYKDFDSFKKQASQVPSLQEQIQTLTNEKSEATTNFELAARDATLLKVALDKGVPGDLVSRLQGNTPEEIAADADKLLAQVGKRSTGFNGGVSPGSVPAPRENPDALIRRAAGYAA